MHIEKDPADNTAALIPSDTVSPAQPPAAELPAGPAPTIVAATPVTAETPAAPVAAAESLPVAPLPAPEIKIEPAAEVAVTAPAAPEIKAEPTADTGPAPATPPNVVAFARKPAEPQAGPPAAKPAAQRSRFPLLAASLALAAAIGSAAGAAGTAGVNRLFAAPPAPVSAAPSVSADEVRALREQVTQLRTSIATASDGIAALRTRIDNGGKTTGGQIAKLAEAVDRMEKAQGEPSARLARLAEAIERLEKRTTMAATPAAAHAPETTGSIKPPPLPPLNKTDANALTPVVEGWYVRSVYDGIALVQGRQGSVEVEVGDDIRGAGRVQAIRRHQGRWIVVTSKGTIMPMKRPGDDGEAAQPLVR